MALMDMYGGHLPAGTTPMIPAARHQSIVKERTKQAYETGYSEGYRNGRNDRTPDERRRDDEALRGIIEEMRASRIRDSELDEARKEISRLRNTIRELQRATTHDTDIDHTNYQ